MRVSKGELVYVPNVGPCEVIAQDQESRVITFYSVERGVFRIHPETLFTAMLHQGLGAGRRERSERG